jgi:alcohol dehydrogenase class IV
MAGFFSGTEVCRPAFDDKKTPKISYGLRFPEACAKHVLTSFNSSKVYIIASRTLSQKTDALDRLKSSLGEALIGVRIGISSHTPISEVLEIINEVKVLDIDCLITLGAGSLTDGAKLVRLALENKAYTAEDLNTLWGTPTSNPAIRKDICRPTIPLIHIPTSLSGGEYQALLGATETETHRKPTFFSKVESELVIQDPELCCTTPEWVWLSTGIRAVDHCIETLCSLQSNEKGDLWARRGLLKLIPGLLKSKADPSDLGVRHSCQLGVIEAMCAVSSGVPLGASHAIGHQLGPLGVGHGETSCILLPAVCKYNAAKGANNARQAAVVDLLLKDSATASLLQERKLDSTKVDLGDILDAVIFELGLPRSLGAVGIGKDKLHALAVNSLTDIWIKTNAVPITEESQVMEILEMCT